MPLSISGYVLEKPRVGSANSPYTVTPDNVISDVVTFYTHFTAEEDKPRCEYLVQVFRDGDLPEAKFCWTKNEVVQRFDYDGSDQRFRSLPGGPRLEVGVLSARANTVRLKITPLPRQPDAAYPFRLAVGPGVGTTIQLEVVGSLTEVATPGHAQVHATTGLLAWNEEDLATYAGMTVYFQQQEYFSFSKSTGKLGTVGDEVVLLNPIPGVGQQPWVRIGYGLPLNPQDVATDELLASYVPPPGTFGWSRATGLLKFNTTDAVTWTGRPVYYDGSFFGWGLSLPSYDLGTLMGTGTCSSPLPSLPSEGADIIFRLTSPNPNLGVYQPSQTIRVEADGTPDPNGKAGQVQVWEQGNVVLFSVSDRAKYQGAAVRAYIGDLEIERGVSLRLFRNPVDPGSVSTRIKDVTCLYSVPEATLADPLLEAPMVFLPLVPIDDSLYDDPTWDSIGSGLKRLKIYVVTKDGAEVVLAPFDQIFLSGTDGTFYEGTTTFRDDTIDFSVLAPTGDRPYYANCSVQITSGAEQGLYSIVSVESPHVVRLDRTFKGTEAQVQYKVIPGEGWGYTLDYESRQLNLARRKVGQTQLLPIPTGVVQLPDQILSTRNLSFELETAHNSGEYTSQEVGQDVLLEPLSGVVSFIRTHGVLVMAGATASFAGTLVTDNAESFQKPGSAVVPGDLLVVEKGDAKGVYTVLSITDHTLTTAEPCPIATDPVSYTIRRGYEVVADRYFRKLTFADPATRVERIWSLGTAQNNPRLSVPTDHVDVTRFRFGSSRFSTTVQLVDYASEFADPASLAQGVVQIARDSGALNFSTADVTSAEIVYRVFELEQGVEYRMTPELGFIEFTDRALQREEVLVTYVPDETVTDSNPRGESVQERGTYLVRKERTSDRTAQSWDTTFNPLGRTVAQNPPPQIYRGGRPQSSSQVTVDYAQSKLTFLPGKTIVDAFPEGPLLRDESIYINYSVYEAIGGEKSITVLREPIHTFPVVLDADHPGPDELGRDPRTFFELPGDRTTDFPANALLRFEQSEVYLLGGSTYDGTKTTVTLLDPQRFQTTAYNPTLYVSSGPTPITDYFIVEGAAYKTTPRGSNKVRIVGDVTVPYRTGTVLYFSGEGAGDFYLSSGASYDAKTNLTEVVLTSNTLQQYSVGLHVLSRSKRPILEDGAKAAQTSQTPITAQTITEKQPYGAFRRITGQPGQLLEQPTGYTMDDAGRIVLPTPLTLNEEFGLFYAGYRIVPNGIRFRSSYSYTIVPNTVNGFKDQRLLAAYSGYIPDTFYYRIEPMTTFRDEVVQDYKNSAQQDIPTSGPRTSNTAGVQLYKQGKESLYYTEGHLANEDVVARSALVYYNTAINILEDILQNMDGRVVGDHDGRFKFDGSTGANRESYAEATNQIDDTFLLSLFPVRITSFFPLRFKFLRTYLRAYQASGFSRLYPTSRTCFGVTTQGKDSDPKPTTGTQILDFGVKDVTSIGMIYRRGPRALICQEVPAGVTTFKAKGLMGSPDQLLPAFAAGMKVTVPGYGIPDTEQGDPSTVVSVTVDEDTSTITLDKGFTVPIPRGATLTLSSLDSSDNDPEGYAKIYRPGFDVGFDQARGQLLYIEPFPPFVEGFPIPIPKPLLMQAPKAHEYLQATVSLPTSTAAAKFPALYGGTTDDDGDRPVPILNPSFECEYTEIVDKVGAAVPPATDEITNTTPIGYISDAQEVFADMQVDCDETYQFTGTLISLDTIRTTTALPTTKPIRQYDLLRMLNRDGSQGSFRQVLQVTAPDTIRVSQAFSLETGTLTFVATANVSLLERAGSLSEGGTRLKDAVPTFDFTSVSDLRVGHTVVITSGAFTGLRRQVTSIVPIDTASDPDEPSYLTVDPAFPGTGSCTYRIDKSIATFSALQTPTASFEKLLGILGQNTTPLLNELDSFLAFFDHVFTDIVSGVGAIDTSDLNLLTANAVDLTDVTSSHLLYVQDGNNKGLYQVASVPSTHTLMVAPTQPFAEAGVLNFRVVKATGLTFEPLQSLFEVYEATKQFYDDIQALTSSFATQITVLGDTNAYATDLSLAQVGQVGSLLSSRVSDLTNHIANITNVLSSTARLYDTRYVWIDARVNLEKGLLFRQVRALADRIKSQTNYYQQLIKLATLEG